MIAFSCHKCGKQFSLKPEFAGRSTTCSSCKQPLVVPALEQTMAPRPAVSVTVAPAAAVQIAFSCTKCAMKFSVKAEFAGRSSKCPACKEPLVVPSAEQTMTYEPPAGQIQGAPSSLTRAGVDAGVTLQGDVDATSRQTSLQNLMDGKSNDGARYVIESELARGGMGAVLRAVDCDIRREVAVKYLLDQSSHKNKIRFIEEAQITGQLEHPNIVPIHELGVDAKKRIFFAMKMVKGRSLAQILKAQRKGDSPAADAPGSPLGDVSLGRLLNIFVNICNGLAYAHSRGVVHRDLKPANIMVGDFGEVYVMDWGLAKVLMKGAAASPNTGPVMAIPVAVLATPAGPFDFSNMPASVPLATPVASSAPSSGSGKVVTSRELDADLTQEGSVLGTPVYMPPEQATGQIHDIDERSDVYSMGAILYEILTLQPPIDRGGGFPAIIKRVTEGQIEPPEQKNPERTHAGSVPPELAAVAMKALAKRREDRYQSIEFLRKDVERFMEGRSVSAKHDTVRELVWKLIKRNKGVSAATAAALVVLAVVVGIGFNINREARLRAEDNYSAFKQEQEDKAKRMRESVPAFMRAADLALRDRQFDDAFSQVSVALDYAPDHAEALLLRAKLLLVQQQFGEAQELFEGYLKQKSNRAATELLNTSRRVQPNDTSGLVVLAEVFSRHQEHALADGMLRSLDKNALAAREKLQALYRQRIEKAWPGRGGSLGIDANGAFGLIFSGFGELSDLEPLRGMPLALLNLHHCNQIRDLTPLQGMPLTSLDLYNCAQVRDLAPLKGMPLTWLDLTGCRQITDLTPLKGMPLTTLSLNFGGIRDLTPLKGMPIEKLHMQECPNLQDLTPLAGMSLKHITLPPRVTKGMDELRKMKTLQSIDDQSAEIFWKKWDAPKGK